MRPIHIRKVTSLSAQALTCSAVTTSPSGVVEAALVEEATFCTVEDEAIGVGEGVEFPSGEAKRVV